MFCFIVFIMGGIFWTVQAEITKFRDRPYIFEFSWINWKTVQSFKSIVLKVFNLFKFVLKVFNLFKVLKVFTKVLFEQQCFVDSRVAL